MTIVHTVYHYKHPPRPKPPEEHKRRGDAAEALWREMKRRISSKEP